MHRKAILVALALSIGLISSASASTIIWVSFHAADDAPAAAAAGFGFTEASDIGYTDLLRANGYNVVRYVSTATPDAAQLNAADLVIISRAAPSGNYQDAAATTWNTTISAPTMILGAYALRQNRMGFYTGNDIQDTTGDIHLTAADPTHPIFAGISLANGTMANPYAGVVPLPTDGTMSRGISIVNDPANENGTVLGTVGAQSGSVQAGAMVIAEWPAGVTVTHAGGAGTDVLAGPRLVFLTGSREPSGVTGGEAAGVYDLHPDGERMFINAVRYMLGETGEQAGDPKPQDGAVDVPVDTNLSWTAGEFAATRDVYFGADLADVSDAGRADPRGVLVSQGQTVTTFDPGLLEYGTTYYWRIDEVNAAPDFAIFEGEVWSFETEPYAYPLTGVIATASSFDPDMPPDRTVDGSGLDPLGRHSTDGEDMWLTSEDEELPAWIQFEFPGLRRLQQMKVWNVNTTFERFVGYGAKDVVIEYSLDGEEWIMLKDVEIPRAPSSDIYAGAEPIDLEGIEARFVRLVIETNWGTTNVSGLSEVQFLHVPMQAREPQPADGATDVALDTNLIWRPGREAELHEVYFGADADAVAAGTVPAGSQTQRTYTPPVLNLGTTYFWRVDQVGDLGVYAGELWSFTTREFLVIDDFESYNDDDNLIYDAWVDGWDVETNGSQVGHDTAAGGTFGERNIVRSGRQSMPLYYENTGAATTSEAVRTFASARNWTIHGADTLSLWTRGYPAQTPEPVTITANKLNVTGAGADIWASSDEFTYVFKTLTGNGTMVARVVSNGTGTNEWAKGGVMIRDSLNGGSTHAMMVITDGGGNGASFQWRPVANAGSSSSHSTSAVAPPYWVKIERSGDMFTGSISADGNNWRMVGSTTIEMTAPVHIGLCVTSHVAGVDRTYEFDNIATTGSVSAQWQQVVIDQPRYNGAASMYVTVGDSTGKTATATSAEAAIVTDWTQWKIPMADLAGVDLSRVTKLSIGVGDKANPVPASGVVFIDDIGFGKPAAAE